MKLIKQLKAFFLSLIFFTIFTSFLHAQTKDPITPDTLSIFGGTAYNNFEVSWVLALKMVLDEVKMFYFETKLKSKFIDSETIASIKAKWSRVNLFSFITND